MNRYLSLPRVTLAYVLVAIPMLLFAKISTPNTDSDETLSCNSQVNAYVDETCSVDISPASLLSTDYGAAVFDLIIKDANGFLIDQSDLSSHLNRQLTYVVTEVATGQSCWGYIHIEDNIPPVLTCATCTDPEITDPACVISCLEIPLFQHYNPVTGQRGYDADLLNSIIPSDVEEFANAYVTDNCNNALNVSFNDGFRDGDCDNSTILKRNWVLEYIQPNGQAAYFECSRYYRIEEISVYDDLGTPIIIEGDGTPIEDMILMPQQIVIIPQCGVGHTPQEIAAYFDDPSTPDSDSDADNITPAEGDIDCIIENNEGIPYGSPHYYLDGIEPNGLHAQPVEELLCSINITYVDVVLDACGSACSGNVKISRMWRIMDWCEGAFFEYNQIIEIVDNVPPTMEVSNVTASVDPWKCAADVKIPAPKKLKDNCGNDGISYTVKLVAQAPEISGNAEEGYVIHDLKRGAHTLVYEAKDCCGNSLKEQVLIIINDQTAPIPVVKLNLVADLSSPTGEFNDPDEGAAKIFAKDIDNGSYDSCTDVEIYVRRAFGCEEADTIWGDYVKFCCDDLPLGGSKEYEVEFKAVDWNGNENFISSIVTLEDKGSALLCPLDMVLSCDVVNLDFSNTGEPSSQSSCNILDLVIDTAATQNYTKPEYKNADEGNVPGYIGVAVPAYNASCGYGAIKRLWKGSGGETICEQWFVVEPIEVFFDPTTIVFPEDTIVICNDFEPEPPTWVDSACELVGLSLESDTIIFGESDFCKQVINKWSVINWCIYDPTDTDLNDTVEPSDTGEVEGRYDHFQTVSISDNIKPRMETKENVVFPVNEVCVTKGAFLIAIGHDEGLCSSPWLEWRLSIDLDNDWVIDYNYSSDASPIVNGDPNPFYIAKTSGGQAVTIYLPDGIEASKKTNRVDWVVRDGCRNEATYTTYFTIEDKLDPTPYCLNLGTTVMENGKVELWAIDFNVGSTDQCSGENVYYTFTDVPPPPQCDTHYESNTDLQWYDRTFWFYESDTLDMEGENQCGNTGNGFYSDGGYNKDTGEFEGYAGATHIWQPALRSSGRVFTIDDVDEDGYMHIPIYVWDECNNNDFCVVRLGIVDGDAEEEGMVAGIIKTEEQEVVQDVMTELNADLSGYPKYDMTDQTGSYAFDSNILAQDYRISASKEDEALNGVSTIDLVKIQRHILGLEALSSPYKLLAADINNDQVINGLDLIELRKLILGVYTEFPQNDSWRIVAENQLNIDNPWLMSEDIMISEMKESMMDQDFVGVKIGDVDGSAVANSYQASNSSRKLISLDFQDKIVEEGESFSITFSSEETLAGFQFSLNLENVEFVDLFGNGITTSNISVSNHVLSVSYDNVEYLNGELFVMDMIARKSGKVSELVQLAEKGLKAEAYLESGLEIVSLGMSATNKSNYILHQNEPNPFKGKTVIDYTIPEAGLITFRFYDLTGKLLLKEVVKGLEGENSLTVDASDFPTGINYYKMVAGDFEATRQLIVIE